MSTKALNRSLNGSYRSVEDLDPEPQTQKSPKVRRARSPGLPGVEERLGK